MPQDQAIVLVPYNSTWPAKFVSEKALMEPTIGQYVTGGIHHIGSTAISGMAAKPIIDILVGVESLEKSKPCIEILSKIHYQYFPYKADVEHWFCKPTPAKRTHHLHLIPTNHPEFKAKLAFRDYLRNHTEEREAYETLKTTLAKQFPTDREAYTRAKENFVRAAVKKALE